MVTRPSPEENPAAIAPGIVHIRNSPATPPLPTDVVIGDPQTCWFNDATRHAYSGVWC